jgi:hypothetical protein
MKTEGRWRVIYREKNTMCGGGDVEFTSYADSQAQAWSLCRTIEKRRGIISVYIVEPG